MTTTKKEKEHFQLSWNNGKVDDRNIKEKIFWGKETGSPGP